MVKILRFLKPFKATVFFALLLTIAGNAMTLLLPRMMSLIVNNGINAGDVDYIKKIGLVMLGLSALGILISVLSNFFVSRLSAGFGAELRRAVFEKTESLSQCDIEKIGTPSLITRCTNDVTRIQDLLISGLGTLITAPIMLVGGVVMAVLLNARLSLTILFVIPIIVLIAVWFKKKVIPLFKVEQKRTDNLNKVLREKLSGIRVIRAFNRTEYEDERFRQANLSLTEIALKINRLFAFLIPLAVMLIFTLLVVIIGMGGAQINSMDPVTQAKNIADLVGDLQAFVLYMVMIVFSVSMAAAMLIMLPRAEVSAKRINEILDMETLIKEPETSAGFVPGVKGSLEFKDVSFGYPGAEEAVISNITFTAKAGEVTAIIGGTGCGKSTLINLIPRFYDVTEGCVLVDGTDVRNVTLNELHSKIGFVPQKSTLFSGTVAENIRFGCPEATDEQVAAALKTACAYDFIAESEDGLETRVSQNGNNFSGGQKQRLAIARAIVSGAEIFVFDDSFSALDFATDARVRQNIRRDLKDANVIIVAQRVGTIMDADRIIVLDEGKAVGIGTHSELMNNCTVYREIVESQFSKEDLAK